MTDIHGNEPTGYSYSAAEELRSAANSLAHAISAKESSRAKYAREAARDFRGFFATVFERNVAIGATSAGDLSEALHRVASFVTELEQAAKEEDKRREDARAWDERERQRKANWLVGAGYEVGTFFGWVEKDDPAPPDPKPAPQRTSESVTVTGRNIPARGSSSSVSSADPATLRSFQSGSNGLNDLLATPISTFAAAIDNYSARCNTKWGTLDSAGLVSALNVWATANREDASWAGTVAALFESAGSGAGVVTLSDASIAAALAAAGLDVFREDFEIPAFSAMGTPPTNGFADDPVNTATGNFLEPETDVPFTGPAKALEFTRMYNSLDARSGTFGPGWSSALDVRLDFTDEGAAFTTAEGRQIHFPRSGDGWARGIGENFWLEAESHSDLVAPGPLQGDRLVVRDNTGGWWAFTAAGVWAGSGRGSGTVVTVDRSADGLITQLTHEHGRHISIEYAGDRVAYLQVSDGRRVEYLYDADRRLIGVSDAVGARHYRWNEQGLIDQVVGATGVVECENTYDEQGRVTEQLTPYGRTVRFAYLRGRVTSVSNVDGTNTNTWISDRQGRVVGIIDADGNRQSMAYDPEGNLISSTERDGQITVHAYDARGRKTRTVTPEGADITYGYDEYDRVTTVVTASGATVSYEYASEYDRNPSVVLDPLGGRTQLSWEDGLLTHVTDPVGVTLALGYDEFGEQTSTRNAAGDTARLVRDAAGRVREAISPSGASTQYDYDEAGLLISRTDPDGGTWRFERGAGGRMTAQVDPLGARTEVEYGPHGHIVGTTDPLGRTIRRAYDELENVESVTLADGAEWLFAHDALARLRTITDPGGGTWSRDYAPNGELDGTTDPTGVHVAFTQSRGSGVSRVQSAFSQEAVHLDEFGRPVRVEREDGSADLVTYDLAGNPVELLDADGGLTRIERDRAGRVTQVTTPAGRATSYEYDACGRPLLSIDPAGGRTSLTYDADSRVVTRTSPSGDVTEIEYDAMGRIVREAVPGIGVGRYRYDAAGRLVFSHDWRTGIRRFGYDAAGQLTTATNGAGGVTRYEYDLRGRVARIIDPTGGVTARSYTELDRVASSTDPLGRTTTATYDGAGRQLSQTAPDGTTLEWVFDDAGLETEVRADGRRLSHASRDARSRTVTITDDTRPGAPTTHTLRFTRNGQLAERVTVGAGS
nr:RHS repeat protein [Leucobacter sp.]